MNSLETTKFQLDYRKTKKINLEEWQKHDTTEKSPYKITQLQQYNPIYSQFFELNENNFDNISLNQKYQIQSIDTVLNTETKEIETKPIFIKFSPLLDPIRYMIGKYENDNIHMLPRLDEEKQQEQSDQIADQEQPKKQSPKFKLYNNASYIDGFFSFLTSVLLNTHGFKHGVDYYGSFLGIQEKFKMNIEDDLEYLTNSDFFMQNIGKRITLENFEPRNEYSNFGSRGNKLKLNLSNNSVDNDILADSIICIDDSLDQDSQIDQAVVEEPTISLDSTILLETDTIVYEKTAKNKSTESNKSNESSENSSNNSVINYSSDEEDTNNQQDDKDSNWETEDEDDDDDDDDQDQDQEDDDSEEDEDDDEDSQETCAYIHNFPVQMICLEKCDGTLDDLFVKDMIDPKIGASAFFQVIMTLITYQKAFHFTHNDLHTNNIMYKVTDQEFLYYTYNKKHYQVPTYGRLFKIIDFGRGIYKYQSKQFCSDSFAVGGDAATQYNFEPFFNKHKPRLDPNYSFDLCRLGCSIYDFIMGDDVPVEEMDELQKTIARWCSDDNNKNVLYKKNGEERYPNFKLYKMIARTVHKHTPHNQLEFPFFSQFETKESNVECMNLDTIPEYM